MDIGNLDSFIKPFATACIHPEWEWFEIWDSSTSEHPAECYDSGWRCKNCKTALHDIIDSWWDEYDKAPKLNYCPNCGAKMVINESDRETT